ncbi:site-specific integrase [Caballeronia sp. LZ019]|uniref:site-specific integrase n=1 Tax=Caballeronia sp. LZ019 TaxID=3038555 RepID=UPI00286627A0|nr:site-specific integrase [Caballeronia sp. LZ019]MDR5811196.1 site-specific integrase [Caballeronia sp. LZ019]
MVVAMSGISCLYRRPSGIYAVRLVVPKRLRELLGRTEIHTSTGLRSLATAKAAALRIQLHWRERFLAMDTEKLRHESPLLVGEGTIDLAEAAASVGISSAALAGELLSDGTRAFARVQALRCWTVPDLDDVERDYDGSFVLNDAIARGELDLYSGVVRFFSSRATLGRFAAGALARESVFRGTGETGFFVDGELELAPSDCIVPKAAVAQVRARLAAALPAPVMAPTKPPASPATTPTIFDPITARHGAKRFSELFETYKRDKAWGKDQARRMATEAGLFIDLMGDPALGDIEKETVLEFARLLALLPTDIYQPRRKYGANKTLHELIDIAERDGLACKSETTIKGHVGRLSEILGYGVRAGMMRFNPASDFKRGRSVGRRAQDERQVFTPDELSLIFSQHWFVRGAGTIGNGGRTHWRPHYYWLPLLGLLTGARINELSQLYVDDVRQTESGLWYLDFNLDGDKIDEPDKSLKTVNSVRVVPLHGELVRLGLPEYVNALRRAGYSRLFPELKRDPVKGYGKPAGSWFNERFLGVKLGIERNGMKTFHSFRHTFVTALERLGLPERVFAQLAGHERGKTQSGSRYAKDRNADEVADNVKDLRFPALDGIAPLRIDDALMAIRYALRLKAKA